MKTELRAMVEAARDRHHEDDKLHAAFLAALHWIGDELWCGPIFFGDVQRMPNSASRWVWCCRNARLAEYSRENARTALFAAAQEQIRKWFDGQQP